MALQKTLTRFALLALLLGAAKPSGAQGIAAGYPGDVNIHLNAQVLFTEMSEHASLANLFANWTANTGAATIALDATTFPPGSPGQQSLRLFTTAGVLGNPGTYRTAGLYKLLAPGIGDSVFARWYVKYNTTQTFHHSGPRLGGNNPPASTPFAPAGIKPNGADFFYAGSEPTQDRVANSTYDFYNYWKDMRGTTFFPGLFYGNSFINDPKVNIDMRAWNCIEIMLKLNNPIHSTNGELALWINGVKVSQVKPGTTGNWVEDNFFPGAGAPFEGFQWRTDASLACNYLQLLHFVDQDPAGEINSVNYDHIVVAKSYIGPLAIITGVEAKTEEHSSLPNSYALQQNYPNPFNPSTAISFQLPVSSHVTLKVFEVNGREVATLVDGELRSGEHAVVFDASSLPSGVYIYRVQAGNFVEQKKLEVIK